jgi:hypothetical protein
MLHYGFILGEIPKGDSNRKSSQKVTKKTMPSENLRFLRVIFSATAKTPSPIPLCNGLLEAMASEGVQDGDLMQSEIVEFRGRQWAIGKEAVDAIKEYPADHSKAAIVAKTGGTFRRLACTGGPAGPWHVNLSLSQRRGGVNYWHVTTANSSHINCSGMAKPTARQLAASAVLRSAVLADNGASASTLERQLQIQSHVGCNRSMLYRAKQRVLMDVFSDDVQTIEFSPGYLTEFASLNPGKFTSLERDSEGAFHHAIVALDPAWFRFGIALFGVDAAHMKHRKNNGV